MHIEQDQVFPGQGIAKSMSVFEFPPRERRTLLITDVSLDQDRELLADDRVNESSSKVCSRNLGRQQGIYYYRVLHCTFPLFPIH